MKNNIKLLTYTALLTALAIVIPINFGFLKVYIPPFSATIASHVPMFLSMFLGPYSAVMVGLGSALGFLFTGLPPYVAARAFMHVIVGAVGAIYIKKGLSFTKVVIITSVIHGLLEALVVIPFGFNFKYAFITVGIGTILHHFVDGAITGILVQYLPLKKLSLNRE